MGDWHKSDQTLEMFGSFTCKDKPHKPRTYDLPKRTYGAVRRGFKANQFESYYWFHYDEILNPTFCFYCLVAAKEMISPKKNIDLAFIKTEYADQKLAPEKKKVSKSISHEIAVKERQTGHSVYSMKSKKKLIGYLHQIKY